MQRKVYEESAISTGLRRRELAEQERREEAECLVAQLADALDDMWGQFAYPDSNGKLHSGGLSALEHCEEMLEHPAVQRLMAEKEELDERI